MRIPTLLSLALPVAVVALPAIRGAVPRSFPPQTGFAVNLAAPSRRDADLAAYLRRGAAPGSDAAAAEALERGRAALHRGEPAAALAAFDEAAAAAPYFADWVQLLAAAAAAETGDTLLVAARLAAAGAELAAEWGWRSRVRVRVVSGDLTEAIRAAEHAAGSALSAARRAEAWLAAGEAQLAGGDTAAARSALRLAMETAPGTLTAVDAARAMSALPPSSPEDALLVGRVYLRHGNVEQGVAGVDAYLAAGRGSPAERTALRLEAGRALFQGRQYTDAERRLRALASEPVASAVAAEALFLTGRSQYRAGRTTEGLATFHQVIERFPGEAVAAEAAYILADLAQDEGRADTARELFRLTMTLQPTGAEAGLAAMRLGGMAFADADYEGAARVYEDYRVRFPQGRRVQQATYWAGRAHQELGRNDLAQERFQQARTLDPFSYYGVRAAEIRGVTPLPTSLAAERRSPEEPRDEARVGLARLGLLATFGPRGTTLFETERLRRYFDTRPNGWYVLAEALIEGGLAYDGILLGRDLQRREPALNRRLLRILYPFPYQELVIPAARQHGLDPFLAAGLIRQESMFNPAAVSAAGAIGLMQILPATGESLARQAGLTGFNAQRDLLSPEVNIRLGMRYLATRLDDYGGDVVSALAAYNAGAHRVDFWATFPEYGDAELFAERIPFAETRDYVKIVQANARIYEALYGDGR